jgi:hypothetical protein
VNGAVFDAGPAVAGTYLRDVAGGSGSFVVAGAETLAEVMRRKLLQDPVAVNLR